MPIADDVNIFCRLCHCQCFRGGSYHALCNSRHSDPRSYSHPDYCKSMLVDLRKFGQQAYRLRFLMQCTANFRNSRSRYRTRVRRTSLKRRYIKSSEQASGCLVCFCARSDSWRSSRGDTKVQLGKSSVVLNMGWYKSRSRRGLVQKSWFFRYTLQKFQYLKNMLTSFNYLTAAFTKSCCDSNHSSHKKLLKQKMEYRQMPLVSSGLKTQTLAYGIFDS